ARPAGQRDPEYLATVIREEKITTLHFVPAMLQAFLEHTGAADCTTVRQVFCGGDALMSTLVDYFYERLPNAALFCAYGPTEATIGATIHRCSPGSAINSPLGRPMKNVFVYILDAHDELVPIGVEGELCIGGVQVARGYLNQPLLTSERFVANPFVEGERIYKTGDRARYRVNGSLEFLGRRDFQVKIRGLRIELGEIESRIVDHECVREAIVVASDAGNGDKRIVAYYTIRNSLTAAQLRAYLLAVLPDYMVPSAYVALEKLPLSSNGKVDRSALPEPTSVAYISREYQVPVGKSETAIAQIWSELLQVDQVGR
ncbi:MAG: amino acid adenylation domain-containing protein, partial [Vulcanimicrobiaceae bacterium]